MTLQEYAEAQAEISAEFVSQALVLVATFQRSRMTESDWLFLLELLFPLVRLFHQRSAELGRTFYDDQREQFDPDLPRNDAFLGEYLLEWFIYDMEPAKEEFMELDASDDALADVILRSTKSVDNGGRKQIINMADIDPLTVRYARIATGRETCEFCLTLVSRGPVYRSAKSAGLNLDDTSAVELFQQNNMPAMAEMMRKFHPGCDCLVVPVFDRNNWPGRSAFLKAEDLWKKYSKLVDENPSLRNPQNGNQHGPNKRKWSRSEAVMAAIRRDLYNGKINMRDFAAIA
jgi:hypothetical protein